MAPPKNPERTLRSTQKISRPASPSRSKSTVAASRGIAAARAGSNARPRGEGRGSWALDMLSLDYTQIVASWPPSCARLATKREDGGDDLRFLPTRSGVL
jgi:hypothetical protein